MALKADRYEMQTDISFFMNEVAERGGVASLETGGSGAAMDQSQSLVSYPITSSGKTPIGVLLNDMVDIDLTRQSLNRYKNEVQKGSKVTLLRKGYVVTNKIQGTPVAGGNVYVAHSGNVSPTDLVGGDEPNPVVGTFLSSMDQDGYAKVEFNLPVKNHLDN